MRQGITKKITGSKLWLYLRFVPLFCLIILLSGYYIPDWFLEMYISFAPHVLGVTTLGLMVSFVIDRTRQNLAIIFASVILLIFTGVPVYSWLFSGESSVSKTEGQLLEAATLNKLVVNKDYQEINSEINNYDIVAINEITRQDYEAVSKNWKYSIITSCRCDPGNRSETAIFSKKEIVESETISAGAGQGVLLRTSVKIKERQQPLSFYSAHPIAPISAESKKARDEFTQKLIVPRINADKNKSVLVGDFNTSPYSPSYRKLDNLLSEHRNIAKYEKTFKTWCLGELPLLCAPIDHVFVSDGVKGKLVAIKNIAGSDHALLGFEIVLK